MEKEWQVDKKDELYFWVFFADFFVFLGLNTF